MLLFLTTNMTAMMSCANQQFFHSELAMTVRTDHITSETRYWLAQFGWLRCEIIMFLNKDDYTCMGQKVKVKGIPQHYVAGIHTSGPSWSNGKWWFVCPQKFYFVLFSSFCST